MEMQVVLLVGRLEASEYRVIDSESQKDRNAKLGRSLRSLLIIFEDQGKAWLIIVSFREMQPGKRRPEDAVGLHLGRQHSQDRGAAVEQQRGSVDSFHRYGSIPLGHMTARGARQDLGSMNICVHKQHVGRAELLKWWCWWKVPTSCGGWLGFPQHFFRASLYPLCTASKPWEDSEQRPHEWKPRIKARVYYRCRPGDGLT